MKVLFVGASGLVGRAVVPELKADFDLSLTGLEASEVAGLPIQALDVTDFDQTLELLSASGADAVVNCAIADYMGLLKDDNPEAKHRYHENTIEVNVRGAYHLYEAAARAGIGKFVFISSMTTVIGAPFYPDIEGNELPRPADVYACTKLFGENLGMVYSQRSGMSVTCLRLGQPYPTGRSVQNTRLSNPRSLAFHIHMRDIAQAIRLAVLETEPYTCYPMVSGSVQPLVADEAMADLGFKPDYIFTPTGPELRSEHFQCSPLKSP